MPTNPAPKSRRRGDAPEVADSDFYIQTDEGVYVRYNTGDRVAAEHVGLDVADVAAVQPSGPDARPVDGGRDLDERPLSPHEAEPSVL